MHYLHKSCCRYRWLEIVLWMVEGYPKNQRKDLIAQDMESILTYHAMMYMTHDPYHACVIPLFESSNLWLCSLQVGLIPSK